MAKTKVQKRDQTYDDLALSPAAQAHGVAKHTIYTGMEISEYGHSPKFVAEIERRRQAMTQEDVDAFIAEVDHQCRLNWEHFQTTGKPNHFSECVLDRNPNRGRDQMLYVWVPHWLSSFLAKKNPRIFA